MHSRQECGQVLKTGRCSLIQAHISGMSLHLYSKEVPMRTVYSEDSAPYTEDTQGQDKPESVTEPPDNDLIDFDAF